MDDRALLPIRSARPRDAEALARLFAEFHAEFARSPPPMTADVFQRDGFGRKRRFSTLVAQTSRGEVVGFALWHPAYDTDAASPGGYLLDLYVAPSHRRRGFGRRLLAATAAEVEAAGGRFLWWMTGAENKASQAMYGHFAELVDDVVVYVARHRDFEALAASASARPKRA
ncbi:MAG: GNAT family N-acetyltransferase [Alphaproteobacteria bacterium]